MAFAGGSALLITYVRLNETVSGYPNVLRMMGILMDIGIIVAAFILRDPPTGWLDSTPDEDQPETADDGPQQVQYTWREMVRTYQFWLMYAMFVAVSGAGLMLTAKIISLAQNPEFTALVATASATVLPVAGGVGRLVLGEISDLVDCERAMFISFSLCGLGLFATVFFGVRRMEVLFAAVVMTTFFWSPQYTLSRWSSVITTATSNRRRTTRCCTRARCEAVSSMVP